MNGKNFWAEQFEANRAHLRTVAYRMLGSTSEADDAVQETWLRLGRAAKGSDLMSHFVEASGAAALDRRRAEE